MGPILLSRPRRAGPLAAWAGLILLLLMAAGCGAAWSASAAGASGRMSSILQPRPADQDDEAVRRRAQQDPFPTAAQAGL